MPDQAPTQGTFLRLVGLLKYIIRNLFDRFRLGILFFIKNPISSLKRLLILIWIGSLVILSKIPLLAKLGGYGAIIGFAINTYKSSDADIALSWQLLAQDKVGNYGKGNAINVLSTSQCLTSNDVNSLIPKGKVEIAPEINACSISSFGIFKGPASFAQIDMSSKSSVGNILDKLNLANADFTHSKMQRVIFNQPAIANSNFTSTDFNSAAFVSANVFNTNFSRSNFDCSDIISSTFQYNSFGAVNIRSAKIIFSVMSFSKLSKIRNYFSNELAYSTSPSKNINFKGSVIISSALNLENLKYIGFLDAFIVNSYINLENSSLVSFERADLRGSVLVGRMDPMSMFSDMFEDVNLTGADLSRLKSIPFNGLSSAWFCEGSEPKISDDYKGFRPKSRKCDPVSKNVADAISVLRDLIPDLQEQSISPFTYEIKKDRFHDFCKEGDTAENDTSGIGKENTIFLGRRFFSKKYSTFAGNNFKLLSPIFMTNDKIGIDMRFNRIVDTPVGVYIDNQE